MVLLKKTTVLQKFASEAADYLDGDANLKYVLTSKYTVYLDGSFDAFGEDTKPNLNNQNYLFELPDLSCTIRFAYDTVTQVISSLNYSYTTKDQEDVKNIYSSNQIKCFETYSSMVALYAKIDAKAYLEKVEQIKDGKVDPLFETEIFMDGIDKPTISTYYDNTIYGGFTIVHSVYKSPIQGYFTIDISVTTNVLPQ